MTVSVPPALSVAFRAIAEVVYAGDSHEAVHAALCQAAVQLVDGCDHASLLVRRHGRAHTAASSDAVAKACDELELELEEGPCLDVLDDDEPDQHFCADLEHGCDWPRLAERLRSDLGIGGMAGLRIRHDGTKVGALNVFATKRGAFTTASLDQAATLAAFASIALVAMDRGEEAGTLQRGLTSNREIGKAVGLLMAMHDIDDEEAFRLLSRVSQEMNIKVADVAAQLVAKHTPG